MSDLPPLTLLLGPQTNLSLGINGVIRSSRQALVRSGLDALPSRMASPVLRRAVNARPASERSAEFSKSVTRRPAFLAALNFFGPPQAGMMKREMFPAAETVLAKLADIAPDARIVLCVDELSAFFLAARSDALETRVQRTPWEALYELNWSDLAHEIKEAMPDAELVVLGPSAVVSLETMPILFGDAAAKIPDPNGLLRSQISETGRAVLDRLEAQGNCNTANLSELYCSFVIAPAKGVIHERLGIDKVTQALLKQRFEEDLDAMRTMPGTKVLA